MAYDSDYLLASKFFGLYNLSDLPKIYTQKVFPVNDVFEPLFKKDFDIFLSFGGRGSGKSDTVAFHLIEECIHEPYFFCAYGRNVHDTVRNSVHSTLVTIIELLGYQEDFTYSKSPNGSLDITHKNGNRFIAYGGDKPDKLKSIKDPTHILMEEADQFSLEAFGQLGATLRTQRGKNRMYLLFNTEKVNKSHWIRKVFFSDESSELVSTKKVLKIFCNYTDNYFIDQAEYYEQLKLNVAGNAHRLEAVARGAWGVDVNQNPFFYNLDGDLHLHDNIELSKDSYFDLSFDFNHTPTTLILGQLDYKEKTAKIIDHISTTPESLRGLTPIQSACQIFVNKYIDTGLIQRHQIRITGDASGTQRKADRIKGENFYKDIERALGVRRSQIYLPKANYPHKVSYEIINRVLFELKDNFKIDSSLQILLDDLNNSYPDEKLSLDSAKKEFGLHATDAFRYLCLLWFSPKLKEYEKTIEIFKKEEG